MRQHEDVGKDGVRDEKAKQVVIYSPFFYPEPISTGKYNTYLAKAISKRGSRVEVIASHPLYPNWIPRSSSYELQDVVVHRGGAFIRYPRRDILRRLVLEAWYSWHTIISTWRWARNSDIAVFVFPPVFFSVFVKPMLRSKCRVVGIVHDLQGLMMHSGVVTGKGIVGRMVLAAEAYALRQCDQVVCLSRSMAEVVTGQLGLDGKRCEVCYPFVVPQESTSRDSLAQMFAEGYIHVVYSGALGKKQMPGFLLEVFEAVCERRSDIVCHICSRGARFEELVEKRRADLAERIVFHDLVPEDQLGELYQRSDVQVIPQAPGTGTAAFPSKLPNLAAAGVPIFAICEHASELADITARCGGAVSAPVGISSVADEMINFIDESRRLSHEARRESVKEYVGELFSVERIVDAVLGKNGS